MKLWLLAAILWFVSPALAFNIDTARTMMALSDAVHDTPAAATDRIRALGGDQASFTDGASFAAFSPTLFDPGSQVAVCKMNRNGKTVYVVTFRGTELQDPRDLQTDFNFKYSRMSRELPNVRVHTGFLKTANLGIQALRVYLDAIRNDPNAEVVFTGHSLGGAAATVAAAQLSDMGIPRSKISVYAFGAPAVGDAGFERRYRDLNVWRINRPNDPVPKLLDNTIMGFRHIGREGTLDNNQVTFGPPRRPGLIGRFINGIRTLFGLFGVGRQRNLSLTEHQRGTYTGTLAAANVAGLTPAQLAEAPIVAQPLTSVTGRLPI